jgi:hypothetical protein
LRGVRGIGRLISEVTIESLLWLFCAGSVNLARIESPAFFLVLEQVVCSRDFLEFCFRRLVSWMQIGMKFARQFFERVLDLFAGGRSG